MKEPIFAFKTFLNCLIIGMVILSFAGCATMKKEECLTADWYSIGYEDGAKGYKVSRISNHRKACAKFGVTPDLQMYQSGRLEGLQEYCTPQKGYKLGLSGRSYNHACQGKLEEPFQMAYNSGRDIYLFKKDLSKEERHLDQLNQQMAELKDHIRKKESELSPNNTDKNTKMILDEIRYLDRKKRKLRYSIIRQEDLINEMHHTLSDMKTQSWYK